MPNTFVDFRAVKAAVTISMALDHYGVNWLRKKGDELRGRCPIHKGEGTDTFHASLAKNAFQCFSCKARGSVLDLVAAMEQCTVKEAAVKLADWFSVQSNSSSVRSTVEAKVVVSRGEERPENKPLTFELKGIDPVHPYLAERGISKETAETFGIGYFGGRGSMSGRVVIPIHNERGELVAYAGRSIDGSDPKYKLPTGFHKSCTLFNLHRALQHNDAPVVVVEGFFDCMKVWQAGFVCVALMGCSMSPHQEKLLATHFTFAQFGLDGDEPGRTASDNLLLRLGRKMWVRSVAIPEAKQPDQMSTDELRGRLIL